MQVAPDDPAVHTNDSMKQMMMIAPVNTEINKTEYIAHKNRPQFQQCLNGIIMRHFYFEYHNGDDDSQYAIAESF